MPLVSDEKWTHGRASLDVVATKPALCSCLAIALLFACSSSRESPGAEGESENSGSAGLASSGGARASGGTSNGGSGAAASGGESSANHAGGDTSGGAPGAGGSLANGSGGRSSPSGGAIGAGGESGAGMSGGAHAAAGAGHPGGGANSSGGANNSAGNAGASAAGASGGDSTGSRPCDIYAAASTPCVAAHSTVRALFKDYAGPLYQVRRASDKTVKDIPTMSANGFADVSVQDSFCSGTTCTISILYDQTSNKNHLAKSPVAHWLENGGNEANAANGKITVGGHTVHGIYVTGYNGNVAYRNNATKGVAKGDQAEAMYMVVDGKRFSDQCCFDYGNAETSGNDDGNGTMEAVYFGSDITWGGKGDGNGPWIAADLENGVFKSDKGGWQSQSLMIKSAKSIVANFVTAMLKGPSGNHFTLKGGSAQSGSLTTMWDSARPSPGYSPKKLQGAIILGTGGDGSNGGTGTFFEGAMTIGNPPDSVDEAIQANIVAAGYGR